MNKDDKVQSCVIDNTLPPWGYRVTEPYTPGLPVPIDFEKQADKTRRITEAFQSERKDTFTRLLELPDDKLVDVLCQCVGKGYVLRLDGNLNIGEMKVAEMRQFATQIRKLLQSVKGCI